MALYVYINLLVFETMLKNRNNFLQIEGVQIEKKISMFYSSRKIFKKIKLKLIHLNF